MKDLYSVKKGTLKSAYKKRSNTKGIVILTIFVVLIVTLTALIYFLKAFGNNFIATGLVPGIIGFVRKYFFFSLTMQLFFRRKKVFPFIVNLLYYTFISAYLSVAGIIFGVYGFAMRMSEDPALIQGSQLLTGVGFIVPEAVFMTLFAWLLLQYFLYIGNYKFDKALYPGIKTVKEKVKIQGKQVYKNWEEEYLEVLKNGDVDGFISLISPYM